MVTALDELCVSFKLEYFLYMSIPAGDDGSAGSISYPLAHMLWTQRIQNQKMGPFIHRRVNYSEKLELGTSP